MPQALFAVNSNAWAAPVGDRLRPLAELPPARLGKLRGVLTDIDDTLTDDWAYVGDSTNDQAMFELMPLSVRVANIARFVAQLQTLPTYLTRAERGAGFAELAAALLAARG